jgi:hypothetical protein
MQLSNRRLKYGAAAMWLGSVAMAEHLYDRERMMTRLHAAFFEPWIAILNAVLCPLFAIVLTILWWRGRKHSSNSDRLGVDVS